MDTKNSTQNSTQNSTKTMNEHTNASARVSTSASNDETPGDRTMAKKESLSIISILDRIKKLKISDNDKVAILDAFRKGIRNPALGENADLDKIQSKYISSAASDSTVQVSGSNGKSESAKLLSGHQHEWQQPSYGGLYNGMPQMPQMPQYMPQMPYMPYMPQMPHDYMTASQFDILKNKMDSLQFELVDLLRHVKDYTQRYMNSVRQADLEKIDQYINGLFDVDKSLREAREKASGIGAPPEEIKPGGIMGVITGANRNEPMPPTIAPPPETQGSIISSATNGIKNFFSGIGNNLSGITGLVASTANIANNLLSKKVIGDDKPALPPQSTVQSNKNIMSIDEYISSNMNKFDHDGTIPSLARSPPLISSNTNSMNIVTPQSSSNVKSEGTIVSSTSNNLSTYRKPAIGQRADAFNMSTSRYDGDQGDQGDQGSLNLEDDVLTSAIGKLNKKIAGDESSKIVVSTSKNENPIVSEPETVKSNISNMNGGARRISNLSNRVKLLRLKLTKRKLESELNSELNRNVSKHGGSRQHNYIGKYLTATIGHHTNTKKHISKINSNRKK